MKRILQWPATPVSLVTFLAAAACGSDAPDAIIRENWGPPLGYVVIEGRVASVSGKLPLHSWVDIGACHPAYWGGSTQTDEYGAYRITSQGPPLRELDLPWSLSPRPDTLHLDGCTAIVNRDGVVRGSVTLYFGQSPTTPTHYTLNLTVP